MSEFWKKTHTEDGREILFALHRVSDLDQAYQLAGKPIAQKDWDVAEQVQALLIR